MRISIDLNRMRHMLDGDMGPSTSDIVDEEDMGQVQDAVAQALMGVSW
jgi:hypothetical protein